MASTSTDEQPKVTLYWLEQSRSQRILWLLEELGVSYNLEIFHRNKETLLAGPELKKVHALGKSPVITVTPPGSSESVVIAESAFIIEYLLEHFSNGRTLLPKRYKDGQEGKVGGETEEWLRYRYYMHYSEGSLMPLMTIALIVHRIQTAPVPFFLKPITAIVAGKVRSGFLDQNFKTHYEFLESQLASAPEGGDYLCGPRLTGADIMLSFPLIAGQSRSGLTKEAYPKLHAYVSRLEAEPGYKKSVEKVVEIEGKFEAAFS